MIPNSQIFSDRFGAEPGIQLAMPGRLNIIGEHTDYNMGYVLPMPLKRAINFAVSKAEETKIYSKDFDEFYDATKDSWHKYISSCMDALKLNGFESQHFYMSIISDIPIGAGLSSSSALCCGFISSLSELFDWGIEKKEIALLAQKAEHSIGLMGGLMDQYAMLFGDEGEAIFLDCNNLEFKTIQLNFEAHCFCIINSDVKHELSSDSGYNDRRASCYRIVDHFALDNSEIKSLRDIDLEQLREHQSDLDPLDYQRAEYVLEENQRVLDMLEAIEKQDAIKAGQLLYAGQKGLREKYEVSCPEIDRLIELCQSDSHISGARMMGGGFGGCVLVLISQSFLEESINKVISIYNRERNLNAELIRL